MFIPPCFIFGNPTDILLWTDFGWSIFLSIIIHIFYLKNLLTHHNKYSRICLQKQIIGGNKMDVKINEIPVINIVDYDKPKSSKDKVYIVEVDRGVYGESVVEIDTVWKNKDNAMNRLNELKELDEFDDHYIVKLELED